MTHRGPIAPAPRTWSTRGRRVARCPSSVHRRSYPCPATSRGRVNCAESGAVGVDRSRLRGSWHSGIYIYALFSFARSCLPGQRRCQRLNPQPTGVTGEGCVRAQCGVVAVLVHHFKRLVKLGLNSVLSFGIYVCVPADLHLARCQM